MSADSFGAAGSLEVSGTSHRIFRLSAVEGAARLPFGLKVTAAMAGDDEPQQRRRGALVDVIDRMTGGRRPRPCPVDR
jgi:hypothetical protein